MVAAKELPHQALRLLINFFKSKNQIQKSNLKIKSKNQIKKSNLKINLKIKFKKQI